jgi:hypothetical protein
VHNAKKPLFFCALVRGDYGGGTMTFAIFGAAMGALCAVRYRQVFFLLLLSTMLAAGIAISEFIRHDHSWLIVTKAVIAVSAMQLIYVLIALSLHLFRSTRSMLPFVQAAIGKQLCAELEVPYSLPLELSVLVAQLRAMAKSSGRTFPVNCDEAVTQ